MIISCKGMSLNSVLMKSITGMYGIYQDTVNEYEYLRFQVTLFDCLTILVTLCRNQPFTHPSFGMLCSSD
jgi:hypothetical protein